MNYCKTAIGEKTLGETLQYMATKAEVEGKYDSHQVRYYDNKALGFIPGIPVQEVHIWTGHETGRSDNMVYWRQSQFGDERKLTAIWGPIANNMELSAFQGNRFEISFKTSTNIYCTEQNHHL